MINFIDESETIITLIVDGNTHSDLTFNAFSYEDKLKTIGFNKLDEVI